ncbi:MAG: glycosyltransferase family 4 protein [candidate division KSB1 bacterium]|nr:glycosyltransferase family 4 protein [candidate division KSB1 bacterium]
MKSLSILFLPQTTLIGASSRARIYQYLENIKNSPFQYKIDAGCSVKLDQNFLKGPSLLQKIHWYISKIYGRLKYLFQLDQYDCIFIQRESLPYFFPFTELLLIKWAKKSIFDFDDAIFYHYQKKNWLQLFMDYHAVERILKTCNTVIVSNSYLAAYARRFNQNVHIIPTSINIQNQKKNKAENHPPIIGWMGSNATRQYIIDLLPILEKLGQSTPFILYIVGTKINSKHLKIKCFDWKKEKEWQYLDSFDVGIMPLPDTPWTRGKGGYKLLQYMSANVPCVASNVGMNKEIIEHNVNGLLASTEEEWLQYLKTLLKNKQKGKLIASNGWNTVNKKYSIQVNLRNWKSVIHQTCK